jgi:NAD(P)-dependent dehydrogenase (short-subunit alcohol dehydrogenase family)
MSRLFDRNGKSALITGSSRGTGRAVAVQASIGNKIDLERLVAGARAAFGRIDVLVCNAGEPEDIAGAAVFLVSAAGRYVTGQSIVIDGGATVTIPGI